MDQWELQRNRKGTPRWGGLFGFHKKNITAFVGTATVRPPTTVSAISDYIQDAQSHCYIGPQEEA